MTANERLGHLADERDYSIAARILRDLSIHELRLLTNNPDKVEQLERNGITVVERVPLVCHALASMAAAKASVSSQRSTLAYQQQQQQQNKNNNNDDTDDTDDDDAMTMRSRSSSRMSRFPAELASYLRTKVERMRHIMDIPLFHHHHHQQQQSPPPSSSPSPLPHQHQQHFIEKPGS